MQQLFPAPGKSQSISETNRSQLTALASVALPVRGKYLYSGRDKFYVRGVAYGPFRPDEHDDKYHNLDVVGRDVAAIAANGFRWRR
jgi:hypothetical protein